MVELVGRLKLNPKGHWQLEQDLKLGSKKLYKGNVLLKIEGVTVDPKNYVLEVLQDAIASGGPVEFVVKSSKEKELKTFEVDVPFVEEIYDKYNHWLKIDVEVQELYFKQAFHFKGGAILKYDSLRFIKFSGKTINVRVQKHFFHDLLGQYHKEKGVYTTLLQDTGKAIKDYEGEEIVIGWAERLLRWVQSVKTVLLLSRMVMMCTDIAFDYYIAWGWISEGNIEWGIFQVSAIVLAGFLSFCNSRWVFHGPKEDRMGGCLAFIYFLFCIVGMGAVAHLFFHFVNVATQKYARFGDSQDIRPNLDYDEIRMFGFIEIVVETLPCMSLQLYVLFWALEILPVSERYFLLASVASGFVNLCFTFTTNIMNLHSDVSVVDWYGVGIFIILFTFCMNDVCSRLISFCYFLALFNPAKYRFARDGVGCLNNCNDLMFESSSQCSFLGEITTTGPCISCLQHNYLHEVDGVWQYNPNTCLQKTNLGDCEALSSCRWEQRSLTCKKDECLLYTTQPECEGREDLPCTWYTRVNSGVVGGVCLIQQQADFECDALSEKFCGISYFWAGSMHQCSWNEGQNTCTLEKSQTRRDLQTSACTVSSTILGSDTVFTDFSCKFPFTYEETTFTQCVEWSVGFVCPIIENCNSLTCYGYCDLLSPHCEFPCTVPNAASNPNLIISDLSSLNSCSTSDCSAGVFVNVQCNTGYYGDLTLGSCTGTNREVTYSGCVSYPCEYPSSQEGYNLRRAQNSDLENTCTTAGCLFPNIQSVECADETWEVYGAIGITGACTFENRAVTLTGCYKKVCWMPTDFDTNLNYQGYAYDSTQQAFSNCWVDDCENYNILGLSCNTPQWVPSNVLGNGQHPLISCNANNLPNSRYVTMTGCTRVCILDQSQLATGYLVKGPLNGCYADGTCEINSTIVDCDYTLLTGTVRLANADAPCTEDDPYVSIEGCTPVTCVVPPTAPVGYSYANNPRVVSSSTCNSFTCEDPDANGNSILRRINCDDTYSGTPRAIGCYGNDTTLQFAGCIQVPCVLPETPQIGYEYAAGAAITNCYAASCPAIANQEVINGVSCADGFEIAPNSEISVTGCSESDGIALLDGCIRRCTLPEENSREWLAAENDGIEFTGNPATLGGCTSLLCNPVVTGVECRSAYYYNYPDDINGGPSYDTSECTMENGILQPKGVSGGGCRRRMHCNEFWNAETCGGLKYLNVNGYCQTDTCVRGGADEEICCLDRAMCSEYTFGCTIKNPVQIVNASKSCSQNPCVNADESYCCVDPATCETYDVFGCDNRDGYQRNIINHCVGLVCEPTDADRCCYLLNMVQVGLNYGSFSTDDNTIGNTFRKDATSEVFDTTTMSKFPCISMSIRNAQTTTVMRFGLTRNRTMFSGESSLLEQEVDITVRSAQISGSWGSDLLTVANYIFLIYFQNYNIILDVRRSTSPDVQLFNRTLYNGRIVKQDYGWYAFASIQNAGSQLDIDVHQFTPSPSQSPTVIPTNYPSVQPTVAPSDMPSVMPTLSPDTSCPTVSPTVKPSLYPSRSPSKNPTIGPTLSPTPSPIAEDQKCYMIKSSADDSQTRFYYTEEDNPDSDFCPQSQFISYHFPTDSCNTFLQGCATDFLNAQTPSALNCENLDRGMEQYGMNEDWGKWRNRLYYQCVRNHVIQNPTECRDILVFVEQCESTIVPQTSESTDICDPNGYHRYEFFGECLTTKFFQSCMGSGGPSIINDCISNLQFTSEDLKFHRTECGIVDDRCVDITTNDNRLTYSQIGDHCVGKFGGVPDWQDFCFNDCANPKEISRSDEETRTFFQNSLYFYVLELSLCMWLQIAWNWNPENSWINNIFPCGSWGGLVSGKHNTVKWIEESFLMVCFAGASVVSAVSYIGFFVFIQEGGIRTRWVVPLECIGRFFIGWQFMIEGRTMAERHGTDRIGSEWVSSRFQPFLVPGLISTLFSFIIVITKPDMFKPFRQRNQIRTVARLKKWAAKTEFKTTIPNDKKGITITQGEIKDGMEKKLSSTTKKEFYTINSKGKVARWGKKRKQLIINNEQLDYSSDGYEEFSSDGYCIDSDSEISEDKMLEDFFGNYVRSRAETDDSGYTRFRSESSGVDDDEELFYQFRTKFLRVLEKSKEKKRTPDYIHREFRLQSNASSGYAPFSSDSASEGASYIPFDSKVADEFAEFAALNSTEAANFDESGFMKELSHEMPEFLKYLSSSTDKEKEQFKGMIRQIRLRSNSSDGMSKIRKKLSNRNAKRDPAKLRIVAENTDFTPLATDLREAITLQNTQKNFEMEAYESEETLDDVRPSKMKRKPMVYFASLENQTIEQPKKNGSGVANEGSEEDSSSTFDASESSTFDVSLESNSAMNQNQGGGWLRRWI